jgi:uncharacterized protein (DUF488 family)
MAPFLVFTVGHSTRTIDEFVHLLKAHGIQRVIDVRSIPRSRHNPQFSQDRLPAALERFHIHYSHMPGLGGRRRARTDSTNTGWRNVSFRGYADYMETPAFTHSLDRCIALAREERLVLMCAEAVPWRCHRSLIADAMLARGGEVRDITNAMSARSHSLTPWARIRGAHVTYPPADFRTDHLTSARMGNGLPVRGGVFPEGETP